MEGRPAHGEHRAAWIGAAAAVVAALIGAVATVMATQGGGESPPVASPSADGSPTAPAEGPPPQSPPAESPPPDDAGDGDAGSDAGSGGEPAPGSSPEPAVWWEGRLLFDGNGKDFDRAPPQDVVGANDFSTGGTADVELQALRSGGLAHWDGERTPAYLDCAEAAATQGTAQHPLRPGAVLCGTTDEGRVVRFTVAEIPDRYGPYVTVDVVVWEPVPGAP